MFSLLMLLSVIISILLTVVVLLQSSKGGGLAGTFGGGGNMGMMFGTRRTTDFLSKATWWLGGIIALIAVLVNLFFLPSQTSGDGESIIQGSGQQQTIPENPSLPPQQNPLQQ